MDCTREDSRLKVRLMLSYKDGKCTTLMSPRHMSKSTHDEHQEYDFHSSTML